MNIFVPYALFPTCIIHSPFPQSWAVPFDEALHTRAAISPKNCIYWGRFTVHKKKKKRKTRLRFHSFRSFRQSARVSALPRKHITKLYFRMNYKCCKSCLYRMCVRLTLTPLKDAGLWEGVGVVNVLAAELLVWVNRWSGPSQTSDICREPSCRIQRLLLPV